MSTLDTLLKLSAKQTEYELFGDFAGGLSTIQQGIAGRRSADFVAKQLRQNAGQAQAMAQRAAYNEDRNAKYVASAALASAAASGGGASDPTVVNLIARNAGEMAYRKQLALYEGEDKARMLNLQADATQYSGKSGQANAIIGGAGSIYNARSTVMKGQAREASLRERFGGDGPRGVDKDVYAYDNQWWMGEAPRRDR